MRKSKKFHLIEIDKKTVLIDGKQVEGARNIVVSCNVKESFPVVKIELYAKKVITKVKDEHIKTKDHKKTDTPFKLMFNPRILKTGDIKKKHKKENVPYKIVNKPESMKYGMAKDLEEPKWEDAEGRIKKSI